MIGYKKVDFANFNCTFGDKNKEMGKYFLEVIYPSLQQGYSRKTNNGTYYIDNFEIINVDGLGYVLTRIHIINS